jgi:hypothetical protein
MNTELVGYGIFEEQSDIRAHVSPQTKSVYVFKTAVILSLIQKNKYRNAPAYQPGFSYATANGLLVPVEDVPDIRCIKWHSFHWWEEFSETDTTTEKGKKAVWVVRQIMKHGRFPLWFDGEEVSDIKIDIEGTDVIVYGKWRIQVKCDWKAGTKKMGGSGNLFIQTHEINPGKLY